MSEENAAQVDENMPPEDVTPEEVVTTPSESATAQDLGNEPAAEPTDDSSDNVQKRINKVTADKYAEKRRADAAEAELAELKASQAPAELVEPKLEDFDYDEGKFHTALASYHGKKASVEAISNYQSEQNKKAETTKHEELTRVYNERADKYKETVTDFDQSLTNLEGITFPAETFDAMFQAEDGPQLAYYLSKHLDVAEQVATATPTQAALQLGRISAQLANNKPTKAPSAAPSPITPVTSGGTLNKDMSDMSMDEIYALE